MDTDGPCGSRTINSFIGTGAYEYLQQFGIKYVLIALDELETAAELLISDGDHLQHWITNRQFLRSHQGAALPTLTASA